MVIFPDVMRWMWRDYPAPIEPGRTQNDMLRSLLIGGEGWQQVGDARTDVAGLASDQKGEIAFADNAAHVIYKLDAGGNAVPYVQNAPVVSSAAFGPNGSLYVATPDEGKIMAYDAAGKETQVADGVKAHAILVNQDGNVFATEQGEHLENPSKVWMIKPDGTKNEIDEGLSSASGLTFLPDKQMLFVAEATTKWVYSYVVNGDGTLVDKEPFYWLHMTDVPNDSGAQEMVVDTRGNLYVATRMGIQVCDRNGRVRGILPLPTPCGPVKSLCWSGEGFDTLVATDGQKIFKRKLNIHGYSQWSAPAALPPSSGG
jgi:sugar lactone lactonase YvrE